MRIALTIGDFLERAAHVYGDRTAIVDEPDADAALRCPHRSRDASRASADDEDIEARLRIPIHPSSRPCLIDTGSGSFDNVAFH